MRALFLLLLVVLSLVLLMAGKFLCPSCHKDCGSSQKLSQHISASKKCKLRPVLEVKSKKNPMDMLERAKKVPRRVGQDVAGEIQALNLDEASTSTAAPSVPPPPPEPEPEPIRVELKPSRTGRTRFLPARLRDNLPSLSRSLPSTFQTENIPEAPAPAPMPMPEAAPLPSHFPTPTPEPETPLNYVNTPVDEFGVYRSYPELPDSIPDEEVSMADVCEGAGFPVPPPSNPLSIFGTTASNVVDNIFTPFLNATVFRLMEWFYNENQTKSIADLNNLVNNVLLPDDFQQEHLRGFSAQKVLKDMDDFGGPKEFLQPDDGWIESSVRIPVPCSGVKQLEKDAPTYELKGIFYRKPLEVVKSVFQSTESKKFHYTPFRLYQQHFSESSNTHESVLLHSELTCSCRFYA
ncbi:hypothetical protein EV361DRAFT_120008 [Lentinula raphanica]|nr:hypothetical protein EV361DRAFT_120008 [Lentinula raphanica]